MVRCSNNGLWTGRWKIPGVIGDLDVDGRNFDSLLKKVPEFSPFKVNG
jgi:hypothetical protein